MPTADIPAAVESAVTSRCLNNGQSCISAKRFLIHESVYYEFSSRFTEAMASQIVGDPTLPETNIGPLAAPRFLDNMLRQVKSATDAGGRILTGGTQLDGPGNYFPPTVIADVPRDAAIAKEETFGPLALLFHVHSITDAIALANDTPFGLGASIWTNDLTEQQRFITDLQCGGVFFNTPVASDPRLPFGGIKHSGHGRELSAIGMREFLNAKTIVVAQRPNPHQTQPTLFED
jgi:succinate-semialdehyde dehydrogenase/glutarate-semialdehyde dehydrogenase